MLARGSCTAAFPSSAPLSVRVASSARLARPKSVSQTTSPESSRKFEGLTSRWMTPRAMSVAQGLGRLTPPAGDVQVGQGASRLLCFELDLGEAAAVDQLHGVVMNAALGPDGKNRDDIRVVEASDGFGFAAESLHGLHVGRCRTAGP